MKKQKGTKIEFDGLVFDSKGELSCYKKLVSAYGKENVFREPYNFIISKATKKYNTIVFRSWAKSLSDRKFPHDSSDRVFTPDFVVKHNGKLFIIEFKNAFTQNADYPLRRTLFLRSWNARNYTAFFECKSQEEVREAIYKINHMLWV